MPGGPKKRVRPYKTQDASNAGVYPKKRVRPYKTQDASNAGGYSKKRVRSCTTQNTSNVGVDLFFRSTRQYLIYCCPNRGTAWPLI